MARQHPTGASIGMLLVLARYPSGRVKKSTKIEKIEECYLHRKGRGRTHINGACYDNAGYVDIVNSTDE